MKFLLAASLIATTIFPAFAQDKPDLPAADTSQIEEILGGKSTIKYPHPRDPSRFGDVVVKFDFKNRSMTASNKTGTTKPGIIVLASGGALCGGIAEFGFSCFLFEKRDGKVYVRFPVSQGRGEWKNTEVRVE